MNSKRTSKDNEGASAKSTMSAALGIDTDKEHPTQPSRPPRIPMNAGLNLQVPQSLLDEDNYSYRFFAENQFRAGRLQQAGAAYWEHVTDENGNNIKRASKEDTLYLMKLEKKYHLQDLELKRQKVRVTMEKQNAIGDGEYAPTPEGYPEGGQSAVTKSF